MCHLSSPAAALQPQAASASAVALAAAPAPAALHATVAQEGCRINMPPTSPSYHLLSRDTHMFQHNLLQGQHCTGVVTSGEQEPLCSVHNPLPRTIPVSHWHLHPSFSAQDSLGPERCLCCSPACRGRGPTPAPHVQERERERRESSTVPSASFFLPLEIAEKEETCQKTH